MFFRCWNVAGVCHKPHSMWDTDKAIQVPESDVIRIHIPHRLFRRPGEDSSSQDGDDFEMKIALMKGKLTINIFFK